MPGATAEGSTGSGDGHVPTALCFLSGFQMVGSLYKCLVGGYKGRQRGRAWEQRPFFSGMISRIAPM